MKKLIFGFLIFMPLQMISGQDKIITIQKDTIHCRIISVSSTHIQYEQNIDEYMVGKFMPTEQVLEYYRNPKTSEISPHDRIDKRALKPSSRWIIGIYPGRGSLLESTTDDEKSMIDMGIPKSQAVDYNKQLKHGWSINGDIHYMFSDYFGLGAKYSLFTSSVQKDLTIAVTSIFPEYLCMGMKENQYIHYAGPSVIFRQWLDENHKFQLTETLSAGYVHYRDETRMDHNQYTFIYQNMYGPVALYNILAESNTWGAHVGFSADYYPVPWLSVGVNAGFMYARLTKADMSTKEMTETVEFDKKDYTYLTRIDYSLGIRFYF